MSAAALYQDIIHLSRPISMHPKMAVSNRAKLFTPFAALRGFDIEIISQEQDRLLVPQITIADDQRDTIWHNLNALRKDDWAIITHFTPVKTIENQVFGEYSVVSAPVIKVDDISQLLVVQGASIPFENIYQIVVQKVEGDVSA